MTSGDALEKAASFLSRMPDWFKAVLLGGALVLASMLLQLDPADDLVSRVEACERRVGIDHEALLRIEQKLDDLILHLIPHKLGGD